jgi:hypothetical protein
MPDSSVNEWVSYNYQHPGLSGNSVIFVYDSFGSLSSKDQRATSICATLTGEEVTATC